MRLGRIGFDHIMGYLSGGAEAWRIRPELVRNIERVTAAELVEALAMTKPPFRWGHTSRKHHDCADRNKTKKKTALFKEFTHGCPPSQ